MPASEIMHKFKEGKLHSGSSHGPIVHNRNQAIAIKMSYERKEAKEHYTDSHARLNADGSVMVRHCDVAKDKNYYTGTSESEGY
jgi:uncharacterized protein DUF6496